MLRVHNTGDLRCKVQQFECPSCDETFPRPNELQNHIEIMHVTLIYVNSTKDRMLYPAVLVVKN